MLDYYADVIKRYRSIPSYYREEWQEFALARAIVQFNEARRAADIIINPYAHHDDEELIYLARAGDTAAETELRSRG
jgi:hypothetical protein